MNWTIGWTMHAQNTAEALSPEKFAGLSIALFLVCLAQLSAGVDNNMSIRPTIHSVPFTIFKTRMMRKTDSSLAIVAALDVLIPVNVISQVVATDCREQ